jgi:hypothetical protein
VERSDPRGAGGDQIAGLQRHDGGDGADQVRDPEDHVRGPAALHDDAIEACLDREGGGVEPERETGAY